MNPILTRLRHCINNVSYLTYLHHCQGIVLITYRT